MIPDLSKLLNAILEDPLDDTLRLVYSDALDESGDSARAEFIRLQIKLADYDPRQCNQSTCEQYGHGACSYCSDWTPLKYQNGEILSHGGGYFNWSPFPIELHLEHHQAITYRRGFVEEVSLPLEIFLDEALSLFSTQPVLKVYILDKQPIEIIGWNWMRSRPEPESPWFLPPEIWDILDMPLAKVGGGIMESSKNTPNRDDALRSLSQACVAYGRKLANLPALQGGVE